MVSITALKAKTNFGELLEQVARSEEVVITKHDKPVARLSPEGTRDLKSIRRAVGGLRHLRLQIARHNRRKAGISKADVKSWIAQGRR
jgi:prevent-host-death family protein